MKFLIADDHALFRDNMARYITIKENDASVIQVSDFHQALKVLEKHSDIDMIIYDLDMTDLRWEDSVRKIRLLSKDIKIVVISIFEEMKQIKKMITEGVQGYILRRTDLTVLKSALDTILDGKVYVPKIASVQDTDTLRPVKNKAITVRQKDVLMRLAEGKSNKQIAFEMGVSEATIKLHINALFRSLNVSNRTQAVITAQKIGLI